MPPLSMSMKMHLQTTEADHIAAKDRTIAIPAETAVVMSDWRGVNLAKAFQDCRLKSCPSTEVLITIVRMRVDNK